MALVLKNLKKFQNEAAHCSSFVLAILNVLLWKPDGLGVVKTDVTYFHLRHFLLKK